MPERVEPPSHPGPYVPEELTPQQSIASWLDLMRTCDRFLMAGLKRDVGPDGDVKAAFRAWYAQYMEDHDRMLERLVKRMRSDDHGN